MVETLPETIAYHHGRDDYDRSGFPGAERISRRRHSLGNETAALSAIANHTFAIGFDSEDERPAADSSVDFMARAQLVSDPIVASEDVGDRSGELDEVKQRLDLMENQEDHRRRCQRWIWVAVVLILIVATAILIYVFVVDNDGSISSPLSDDPTAQPNPKPTTAPDSPRPTFLPSPISTTAPTLAPTPAPTLSTAERWITLIQSRMPSTWFADPASPQRQALDWMLKDPYTLALQDSDDRIVQRFALAVLYYATNGPSWILAGLWVVPLTECEWGEKGFTVFCTDGEVVDSLQLPGESLAGSIPGEVGLLSSLTWLSLFGNHLEGPIPTEVGLLTALTSLQLVDNVDLSGAVPTEMENLTNLQQLTLWDTQLSGSIPSNLCRTLVWAEIDFGIECDCCDSV